MMLSQLLEIKKGITCIIGGGGKTTLLHTLADELKDSGTVLLTTTTHIMKSNSFYNVITTEGDDNLSTISEQLRHRRCLCVGSVYKGDKLSAPCVSLDELSSICDYVLVEADGSKHLPLKAHMEHEPVVPDSSTQTLLVVGVDAVGDIVQDSVHRAEKMCELLSCEMTDIVTPQLVAQLLAAENLHDKVIINKCDTHKLKSIAEHISENIDTKCIISSLLKGEWYVSSN